MVSIRADECAMRKGLCRNGDCVDTEDGTEIRKNCSACTNTFLLGYRCQCHSGYENPTVSGGVDVTVCVDVNECVTGRCRGGECRNRPGSFDCHCPPGYHLSRYEVFSIKHAH